MSHADVIEKNYDVLLRCTTINYYVIDFLKAEDVIDRMQEAKLKAKRKNSLKQCFLLFQWLKEFSSQKYESFLQVMNDTEQEHVTNLLRGNAEEGHLPLSDVRHDRLEKIRHKIAHVICIESEVIAELRSSKAISRTDVYEIRAEKDEYVKSSKLISAIMRRSNHSYDSFQEVLRKTRQTAAAQFLKEGEMIAVHLTNNRPDIDEILSFTFKEAIRNNSGGNTEINELLMEMNGFGLNPVKAIPGQSIVIFIYCKTVYNAVTFMKLFNSGCLQYILDCILNRLLLTVEPHNMEKLDSRISLEDEEIVTLEEFTGIEGWKAKSPNRLKIFGGKCGRDATTQTDEDFLKKKITAVRLSHKSGYPFHVRSRRAGGSSSTHPGVSTASTSKSEVTHSYGQNVPTGIESHGWSDAESSTSSVSFLSLPSSSTSSPVPPSRSYSWRTTSTEKLSAPHKWLSQFKFTRLGQTLPKKIVTDSRGSPDWENLTWICLL